MNKAHGTTRHSKPDRLLANAVFSFFVIGVPILLLYHCGLPVEDIAKDKNDEDKSDDATAWIVSKWTGILKVTKKDTSLADAEKSHRIILDMEDDGAFTLTNSDDQTAKASGVYALLPRSLILDIDRSSWSLLGMAGERLDFDLVRQGRNLTLTNDDFAVGLISGRPEEENETTFVCRGDAGGYDWTLDINEETFSGRREKRDSLPLTFTGSSERSEGKDGKSEYRLVIEESNNDHKERGAVLTLKYKSRNSFEVEVKSASQKVMASFVCRK